MIDEKKLIDAVEKEIEFAKKCNMPQMVAGMQQIKSVIERQEKVLEWIPYTEENKPKKEGFYLITVEIIFLGEPELLVKKEWFSEKNGCFDGYSNAVVAWMPLPEPYKN